MRPLLVALVVALYAAHQDIWFWRTARPLVFGMLPIGLAYHAAYAIVTSLVLLVIVVSAWPDHLDPESESGHTGADR